MKKFFAVLLAVVLVFAGFLAVRNQGLGFTAQASAEETAADEEVTVQEAPAPKIELDFDKLYALHAPEDVIMEVNGSSVTWGDYFYCLYSQTGRIYSTLQQMAMYYGYNASWDDPIDETGAETVGSLAVSNSVEMFKQQVAVLDLAEETGTVLSAEDEAAIKEEVDGYFAQLLGEDATEEQKNDMLSKMYLTTEQFDNINRLSGLYAQCFNEGYGEHGEKVEDAKAVKYLEDNGYLAANHILFMTIDPATREALDEDAAAEKKALAEDTLAKLQAIEDKDGLIAAFAELKAELCEDTGKAVFPDGYLFTPGTMVPEFEDATSALGEYEISGLVESDYGYHIIMRLPLDPDMAIDKNNDGSDVTARYLVAQDEFTSDIQSRMDAMTVEYVNGYTAPKISDFVK